MSKKLSWIVVMAIILNLCFGSMAIVTADSGDQMLQVTFAANATANNHFWAISKEPYEFKKGDYIEYDVYLNDNLPGLGNIEIYTLTGGLQFRGSAGPWVDQNGLPGEPKADISSKAYKQWYHRKLAVPEDRIGMAVRDFCVAIENTSHEIGDKFVVLYDNFVVTNGGNVVHTVYQTGQPLADKKVSPSSNTAYDVSIQALPSTWSGTPVETAPSETTAPAATATPVPAATVTPTPTPTATPAPVKPTVLTLKVGLPELTVNKDGKDSKVQLDAAPVITKDNRTFLPIRAVVEALSGSLTWEAATQKIGIEQGKNKIEMWINKPTAKVNGLDKPIDSTNASVAPYISPENRTMVPVRFVIENMGATVEFDAKTQVITVTYTPEPAVASTPTPTPTQTATPNANSGSDEEVFILRNSEWNYSDVGPLEGNSWREINFDDSSWASGKAPLGYAFKEIATTVGFGDDSKKKHTTTYFRKSFNVDNPSKYKELQVSLAADDGAVVYLNGTEIFRLRINPGPVNFDTFAKDASNNTTLTPNKVDPSLLVKGKNVIAVEVHQMTLSSSDLFFDLQFEVPGAAPTPTPTPTLRPSPTPQTINIKDEDITLRFIVAGDSRGSDTGFYTGADDGTNGAVIEKLLANIKQLSPQPKFLVGIGDLIAGSPNKIPEEIKAQLNNFRKHFTAVYPIEFFYPGIGNHEIKGSYAGEIAFNESFPEFAANPKIKFLEGSNNSVWYTDEGDTRLFYLNANRPGSGENHKIIGSQFEWLKANIDSSKKNNIFLTHEPFHGTWKADVNFDRYPYERNLVWELFDKSNNPMVFVAHEHLYSRRIVNSDFNETVEGKTFNWTKEIMEVTTGGFGGPLNGTYENTKNVVTNPPCIAKYHYTIVDIIKDNSIRIKAVDIDGKTIEEYHQTKW